MTWGGRGLEWNGGVISTGMSPLQVEWERERDWCAHNKLLHGECFQDSHLVYHAVVLELKELQPRDSATEK